VYEVVRTHKLASRFFGPYPIKRVVNANAYERELPPELRIHPVVNVSMLKPYRDGTGEFPHRPPPNERPPPEAADAFGQEEYHVERVLEQRTTRHGRTEYLVLWRGYPPEEATWQSEADLAGARRAVRQYHKRALEAPPQSRARAAHRRAPRAGSAPVESERAHDAPLPYRARAAHRRVPRADSAAVLPTD